MLQLVRSLLQSSQSSKILQKLMVFSRYSVNLLKIHPGKSKIGSVEVLNLKTYIKHQLQKSLGEFLHEFYNPLFPGL